MYNYIGTVTFHSHLEYSTKIKLIKRFKDFISDYLEHTDKTEHTLKYSIEYHKVSKGSKDDDLESPHLHYILTTNKKLPKYRFTSIIKALQQYYGRSQLFLATTMKLTQWEGYILKDVEKNERILGWEHYYVYELKKTDTNVEEELWLDEDF